jgi:hypothetical protein
MAVSQPKLGDYAWVALFFGVPLVLLLLPANFFDKGRPICPSKVFFDVECLGCGLTRGIMHLIHGDWQTAIYFNWLTIPVFFILAFNWILLFKGPLSRVFKLPFLEKLL